MSGQPRVWMLTSVHPALDTRIFYREALSARAAGFDVTVLAPDGDGGRVEGVGLRHLPGPRGRLGRVVRWPILVAIAARARADLYQIHDPELLPWAVLLRILTRRPVIYDSHEFFAEALRTKPWIPRRLRPILAAVADRVEKAAARRLSAVVVVTPDMAERFRPVHREVVTVMNLPPGSTIRVPDGPRSPVAIYAGLMDIDRGLDILHATAVTVRARHPGFELRVLGTVDWSGLPEEAARSEADWAAAGVRFLGRVPQPRVADELAIAAVGWLPMSQTAPSKRLAWPVKLGEYMAAGLPVVASDLPVQAAVIAAAGCGRVVARFDGPSHGAAIADYLDDPEVAARDGDSGRAYAEENLLWEQQARNLVELYDRLLGRRDRAPGAPA